MPEFAPVTILTLVKIRDGVDPDDFARFAVDQDLPTWRQRNVVLSFETYRIPAQDQQTLGAEFVEKMEVRSIEELEEVGRTDPAIAPLAARFSELADESAVRRVVLEPLVPVTRVPDPTS